MKRKLVYITLFTLLLPCIATAQDGLNVWFLIGDVRSPEPTLIADNITEAMGMSVSYENMVIETGGADVVDLSTWTMNTLADVDVLWFSWNGPGHDSLYFLEPVEQLIKDWVAAGGMVWISAFDDNYTDANGNQVGGWFPIDVYPGSISNTGDSDVDVTADGAASGLFDGVDLAALILDDNFATDDPGYQVFATRVDNGEIAAFRLDHGDGFYLSMCVDTRDNDRAGAALPLFQNVMDYLVANGPTAVEAAGKLTTTWGTIKHQR